MSQNTTAMQRGAGGETTGATDMTTQQPEALPALIERFRGLHFDHAPDGWPAVRTREITALLARITELESQLAQRFDAADMATAAAQGFRDGVASVSAGWQSIETAPKDGQAILVTDGRDCYCVEWDEELDWWTVDDNKLGPFRLRGSAPTHWMPTPTAPRPC